MRLCHDGRLRYTEVMYRYCNITRWQPVTRPKRCVRTIGTYFLAFRGADHDPVWGADIISKERMGNGCQEGVSAVSIKQTRLERPINVFVMDLSDWINQVPEPPNWLYEYFAWQHPLLPLTLPHELAPLLCYKRSVMSCILYCSCSIICWPRWCPWFKLQ